VLGIISGGAHSLAFLAIGLPSPLPLGLWVGFMSQFIRWSAPTWPAHYRCSSPVIDKPISGLWTLIFLVIYQQIENYVVPAPRVTRTRWRSTWRRPSARSSSARRSSAPSGALLALPAAATLQAFISSYVHRHEVDESALAVSLRSAGAGRRAPPRAQIPGPEP
jgi:hypothetical protein